MTTLSAQSQLGFTSSKLMRKVICSLIALVAQSLVNPAIQGALATLSTHAILNYASPIIQPTVKWSVVLVTSTLLLLQLKILPMEKNFSLITTNSLPRLVLPKVADVMNVRRLRSLRIGRQCHIQVLHSIIYPVLVLVSALVFSYLCLCVCVCVCDVCASEVVCEYTRTHTDMHTQTYKHTKTHKQQYWYISVLLALVYPIFSFSSAGPANNTTSASEAFVI